MWLVYMANIQCLDILPQIAKTKSDGGGHSQCGWWSKQFLLFFFHGITQIITILPWWWWWNSVFLINYAGANVCASLSVPMSLSPWLMRPITYVRQEVDVKDVRNNSGKEWEKRGNEKFCWKNWILKITDVNKEAATCCYKTKTKELKIFNGT